MAVGNMINNNNQNHAANDLFDLASEIAQSDSRRSGFTYQRNTRYETFV